MTREIEVSLEEVEQRFFRRQEDESEVDAISNIEFPSFEDPDEREDYEEKFNREIKDFEREMKALEAEWEVKIEKIEKDKIKWDWNDIAE